jgi:DNA topoisomerase-1
MAMRVRRIGMVGLVALVALALRLEVAGAGGAARSARGFRPQSKKAAAAKFARVARFEKRGLGRTRAQVARRLASPKADRDTAVAAIVRIMDTTYMRVGSEKYARKGKPSFGASSLRKDQVRVRGDRVSFDFMGKSGVHWQRTVRDRELAGALKLFLRSPGRRLFQLETGAVTEKDVRAFLRPLGAVPKDLRTLHANRLLDGELARLGAPSAAKLKLAIENVAAQLGHTPAISRAAYLDPVKLETYLLRTR